MRRDIAQHRPRTPIPNHTPSTASPQFVRVGPATMREQSPPPGMCPSCSKGLDFWKCRTVSAWRAMRDRARERGSHRLILRGHSSFLVVLARQEDRPAPQVQTHSRCILLSTRQGKRDAMDPKGVAEAVVIKDFAKLEHRMEAPHARFGEVDSHGGFHRFHVGELANTSEQDASIDLARRTQVVESPSAMVAVDTTGLHEASVVC